MYLPFFVVGYFLYNKKEQIDSLKGVYKEFVDDKNRRYLFQRMIHSQVFYMTCNKVNKDTVEYRDSLNSYLKWLEC